VPPAGGLQQQRGLAGVFPGWSRLLAPVLWLLLLAIVYADPLFVRRNFAGRDLLGYNLPIEKAVHDSYARGRWPVWLAEVSGGRPLLPNLNVGALYPVRPLLCLVPFPLAMRIYPILHWAIAGLGVVSLLRVLGASPFAGFAAAAAYVFSGVGVSEIFYTNHHPGFALLPWIVWSVARPASGLAGRIVLSSLLVGLDLLAGDVFTTGAAVAAALLWILLEEKPESRNSSAAAFAISLALSILLALPQLVATALWIPETQRAIAGMKLSESFRFSVPIWRLVELVVPYPFGPTWSDEPRATWAPRAFGGYAMGFFATLYCGSFALIATVTSWRRKGKGLAFARWLALLAGAACILPSLWPEAWLGWKAVLPLRYPEKMAVALALAAALFAGKAFDRLGAEGGRRWPIALGVILAIAALAAAAAPLEVGRAAARALGGRADAAASHLSFAFAEAGLLWMAAVLALDRLRRPAGVNRFAALLLVTLAPLAANRRIAQSFREEEVFAPTAFARAIDRRDPERSFRTLGESRYIPPSSFERAQLSSDVGFLEFRRRSWLFYTPALWGRGVVWNDDFDAGDLFRTESLRRLSFHAANFADPSSFFGNVSLRFGIRFPDQSPPPGFRPFGGTGSEAWDENARARPDVRLLSRWREAADAVGALRQLPIGSEVTLETGRTSLGSAPEGSLRILEKTPEVLRAEVEVTEPTYLFVLRGYWDSRSVSIDGNPVSVIPAQLAFSAVAIPAGRHRIEWLETIPGGKLSRWGPVVFVAAALGLFARKRRSEASSS